LMGNIHGQRINADIPEPSGSGFIGRHHDDMINFNDRASQIVDIRQGPGGAIYMIDWYDLNQCHSPKRETHDYKTGRILRVGPVGLRIKAPDWGQGTPAEVAKLAIGEDAWMAAHARRRLQELGPGPAAEIARALEPAAEVVDPTEQLRILWAAHAAGLDDESRLLKALRSSSEYERAWAIQLAAEKRDVSAALRSEFARLAKDDPSPRVRLYLASAAQRLPIDQRLPILESLVTHGEDASDHNLPLMIWYALEPVVAAKPEAAATLLGTANIPLLQEYIARRMAAGAK
ncbi:MAG: dehydrogenase, partial [Chthoniobacteraceae bacterium]